jgi:hypothetical protein
MHGRGMTISTATLGVIGLALLGFESVQAMRNVVLGGVGTTVLFVGLGLVVITGAALLVALSDQPMAAAAPDTGQDPVADGAAPELASRPAPTKAATVPAATLPDTEAGAAAGWTLVHRTDCAGRLDAGDLHASVRRGASLTAYNEGLLIGVGKLEQHRSWSHITTIAAVLAGNQATITVAFDTGAGTAEAVFSGKTGDLAPVATALVTAAPAGVVDVSYG